MRVVKFEDVRSVELMKIAKLTAEVKKLNMEIDNLRAELPPRNEIAAVMCIKRHYVETGEWRVVETSIEKYVEELYNRGYLVIKPTQIKVGYSEDKELGTNFTVRMIFDETEDVEDKI